MATMADVEIHKKLAEHDVLLDQHSARHDKHDLAIERHEAFQNEWRGWFRGMSIVVIGVSLATSAITVYAQMQSMAAHTQPQKETTK